MTKTTIYLDQFAISNMADDSPNWSSVKTIINDLTNQGLVECITSIETVLETSSRNQIGVDANFDFIAKKNKNKYIKHINEIICMQINTLIKGKQYINEDYTGVLSHDFIKTTDNTSSCYGVFKEETKNSYDELKKHYSGISEVIKKIPTQMLYDKEVCNFKTAIVELMNNIKTNSEYGNIVKKLQVDFYFTSQDFKLLYDNLSKNGFEKVDSLHVKNKLLAYLTTSLSKDFLNDLVDLNRITVGLPICDIIICDNVWKNRIVELKLDVKYGTKVFSGKCKCIKELEDVLHLL